MDSEVEGIISKKGGGQVKTGNAGEKQFPGQTASNNGWLFDASFLSGGRILRTVIFRNIL